jgi:hypothetical protein
MVRINLYVQQSFIATKGKQAGNRGMIVNLFWMSVIKGYAKVPY